MKTRPIRSALAIVMVLISTAVQAAIAEQSCFPRDPEPAVPEIAVSLKQLRIDLARCGMMCPPEIANLHGLARIDGAVVDAPNHDVVVFGPKIKPGQPAQKADDLVIALRASTMRYTEVKGNTRWYTAPGVTLNPRPANIAALQRIAANADKNDNWTDAFCAECRKKQDLIVLAIPFQSSSALIMATADYALKKLVNFDLSVDGPGFESLAAKRRRQAEKQLDSGTFTSGNVMSRLWFYPGQVTYREQPGVIILDRADILVRQQRQVSDARGNYHDGGEPDPLTAEWTCDVTRFYRDIAAKAPETGFDALGKLMRMFAVAKLIITKHAAEDAGLEFGYLLDKHRIAPVKVAREWDGVAHVERIERKGKDQKSSWTTTVDMPSCGGVEFDFDPKANLKSMPDTNRLAQATGSRVVASRPSPVAPFWPVRRA